MSYAVCKGKHNHQEIPEDWALHDQGKIVHMPKVRVGDKLPLPLHDDDNEEEVVVEGMVLAR